MALSDEISQQAVSLRDYLAPRSASQRQLGLQMAMQAMKMRQENQMKMQYLQQLKGMGVFGDQQGVGMQGMQQAIEDPRAVMSLPNGGAGDINEQQIQPIMP